MCIRIECWLGKRQEVYRPLLRKHVPNLGLLVLLTLTVVAWNAGCGSAEAAKETEWLGGVEVWQTGEPNDVFNMSDDKFPHTAHVPMSRKPFELRLPAQDEDVAIQICAAFSDPKVRWQNKGETGKVIDSVPCLSPGTGMAAYPYPDPVMGLNWRAHNYYTAERRVTEQGQERIVVQKILWIQYYPERRSRTIPVEELERNLFLLVFVNKNGDGRMDADEYVHLVLDFPEGEYAGAQEGSGHHGNRARA